MNPQASETNWYVITGASCSGKSTLVSALEKKGHKVTHEAARIYIDREVAKGLTIKEIRADELKFQHEVLQMKLDTEDMLPKDELIFLDRGIPDSTAYYRLYNTDIDDSLGQKLKSCQYKKVFLLDRLPYRQDYARVESEEEQQRIHELLEEAYIEQGFTLVKVPALPVDDRINFILDNLHVSISPSQESETDAADREQERNMEQKKKKIGIVGGGQLGRMLTHAAHKLGFRVAVLDPTPNSPAAQVADEHILKNFTDEEGVYEVAQGADYITFEIESANSDALRKLMIEGKVINPSPETLAIIKDKCKQKEFLHNNGIPVAPFMPVRGVADIMAAAEKFGYPFLLKARLGAYDGRGNAVVRSELGDENGEGGIEDGMRKLAKSMENGGLYVEKFVPFVKELAVVVARGASGEILPYPPVETIHKNNICHLVLAPAPVDQLIANNAMNLAARIMTHLQGVGIFGIEMFLTEGGQVLINEIAPRVHNSGHHTIEGYATSQFEQHIRAITGMPLGDVTPTMPASVMINILGERSGPAEVTGLEEALAIPGTAVHIYGKLETRPERKMGHITIIDTDLDSAIEKAKRARLLISI